MRIDFTTDELGEATAKLANEIETYGGPPWHAEDGQASDSLCSAFLKLAQACEVCEDYIYVTALVAK